VVKRAAAADRLQRIEIDDALIALFIAAMIANGHVSRQELARAHHLIWSTRRFRRKSGDAVGRLVDRAKARLESGDAASVIVAAAKRIPSPLRLPAYAIVADLLLAEGGIDAREDRFLEQLASSLRLSASRARQVVAAMVVKNEL
jgi:tellurite resistance protein